MPRKPTKQQLQAMQCKENEQPEDVPVPNKSTGDELPPKVKDTNSSRKMENASKNKVSESVSSLQKSPQKRKATAPTVTKSKNTNESVSQTKVKNTRATSSSHKAEHVSENKVSESGLFLQKSPQKGKATAPAVTELKNEKNQSVSQTKIKNNRVTSRSHKIDPVPKSEKSGSVSSLTELSKQRRKVPKSAERKLEDITGLIKTDEGTNSKNDEKTASVIETEKSNDVPNNEIVIENDEGNQKKATQSKPPNRSILQLKITISDTTPPVWRRIQVLNNDTFYQLHDYINEAVGWITPRAQKFIIPGKKSNIFLVDKNQERELASFVENFTRSPGTFIQQNVKLSKYLNTPGDTMYYEYDIADCWMHEVVVEKILPPPGPKAEYPKCQGGKRACPPEEIGGVDAYNNLVEVYKNPNHEEYDDLINNWLAEFEPGWNPEKFDKKKVFKRVRMWVYEGP